MGGLTTQYWKNPITGQLTNFYSVTSNVLSTQTNAKQQAADRALSANTLTALAGRKDIEADLAIKDGQMKSTDLAASNRQELASLRTGYAFSGVKVDSGSTSAVAADRAAWNEYERQKVEYNARLESWGLQYDAALLRQEASNTLASGAGASTSFLSALGKSLS